MGEAKQCSKCKATKPVEEFYRDKGALDGRHSWCKPCHAAQKKEIRQRNLAENRNRVQLHDRRSRKASLVAKSGRAWRKKNPGYTKEWAKNNPEKASAHYKLNYAVRAGKIEKPDACEVCGTPGRVEAHHPDYSKPLDVFWLCTRCHRYQDRLEGLERSLQQAREALRGWVERFDGKVGVPAEDHAEWQALMDRSRTALETPRGEGE